MSALVPIGQKQVIFYDDEVTAVVVQTGDRKAVYVPLRPICDFLGVAWSAQRQRILRDPVLSQEMTPVIVTITGTGQQVESLCLPLEYLNGWLFGINATRVKTELKERLIRYQRECYQVLAEAFQEGRLIPDPTFADLLKTESPAAQAYKMALAIMKMARQQLLFEAQMESHANLLADHDKRLEQIEGQLGDPGRHVTPDQAMQVSQAVKTVALALGNRTRKNEYGAVYGQLYREFAITSYKQLPASQFERAMAWLTDWYKRITGATGPDEVPF